MYAHGQRQRQIPISNGSTSPSPACSTLTPKPPLAVQSQRPSFHFQLRPDAPALHPGTIDRVPVMLGHVTSVLMPPVVTGEQVSADDEEGGETAR